MVKQESALSTGQMELQETRRQVSELLRQHSISAEKWDQSEMDSLAAEVAGGEVALEEGDRGELIRVMRIAFIDVYYNDQQADKKLKLIEERQVFKDGRSRERKPRASVSEKIKAGENFGLDVVRRALVEELGIPTDVSVTDRGMKEKDIREFEGHPGLKAKDIEYFSDVNLTKDQYNPDGYAEHQPDKSTYFKWVEIK